MSNFNPNPSKSYVIYSSNNKLAIDVPYNNKGKDIEIIQYNLHRNSNQQWYFELDSEDKYFIKSALSGLYLKFNNGKLIQGEKEGSFYITQNIDNTYILEYHSTKQAITIPWKDNLESNGLDKRKHINYQSAILISNSINQSFIIELIDKDDVEDVDLGKGDGEKEILKNVSPGILQKIKETGMPLHGGDNPPNVEGEYLFNNGKVIFHNNKESMYQIIYDNIKIIFADQKSHNVTMDFIEDDKSPISVQSVIVGKNSDFTVVGIVNHHRDKSVKIALLVSGSLTDNGIKNAHFAKYVINNANDEDYGMLGEIAVMKEQDADGLAERITD